MSKKIAFPPSGTRRTSLVEIDPIKLAQLLEDKNHYGDLYADLLAAFLEQHPEAEAFAKLGELDLEQLLKGEAE